MKGNSGDLADLIRNMTGPEKRYFKMSSQTFKRAPEHFRLFDYIEGNLEAVSEDLSDFEEGFTGNAAALKRRYLKEQILTSLRRFHQDHSSSAVIMELIECAEILYRKRLYGQSLKLLLRAERLAIKHERFGLQLEIIDGKRKLISGTLERYKFTEHELASEEEKVKELHANVVWARQLHSSVFEFKKKFGYLRKKNSSEFESLVAVKHFVSRPALFSERANFYYDWATALYHWVRSEHEESYVLTSRMYAIKSRALDAEELFYGMLEHLTSCVCTHRYEEVLEVLDRLENLIEEEQLNHPGIEERQFYYKSNYTIIAYFYLDKRTELIDFLNKLEKKMSERSNDLSEQMLQVLKSTLGHAYFVLGNYNKGKKLYWEILNLPKAQIRNDVFSNAKLYFPIMLLELKDLDLMEAEALSSYKFFQLENAQKSEANIINAILKHGGANANERMNIARTVCREIERKLENEENPLHFEDLILLFWSRSIKNGTTVMEEGSAWYALTKSSRSALV